MEDWSVGTGIEKTGQASHLSEEDGPRRKCQSQAPLSPPCPLPRAASLPLLTQQQLWGDFSVQ